MNTMQKEAAVDATSFCTVKNEAAEGRPYEAAKDRANRRGDLQSPDRARQREAAEGRPYSSCRSRYAFTCSSLLCRQAPSSARRERGTIREKSMWAPSK